MNRVWKRFLFKVGKAVAIVVGITAYIFSLIALFHFIGVNPRLASFLLFAVGFGVPLTIFSLYSTYQDAKYEVARENRDLLNKIKG